MEPDQLLELNVNDIGIGRLQEERYTRTVTKKVVLKEIVYKHVSIDPK